MLLHFGGRGLFRARTGGCYDWLLVTMKFIHYVFGFLFERNWHTGSLEWSRLRVAIFSGMLFLLVLGVVLVAILQAPLEYIADGTS